MAAEFASEKARARRIAELREDGVRWDGGGGICERVGIPNAIKGRKLLRGIGRDDLIAPSYERTPEHAAARRAAKAAKTVAPMPAGPPIDSADSFAELVAWLPKMLEELLESEIYDQSSRPPANGHGIYLFTDAGKHLYVGRTGITARARAGKTTSGTSFRSRFDNHIQYGTSPGTAPFANRLMLERAAELGIAVPKKWWEKRDDEGAEVFELFRDAKDRIAGMECRIAPFLDDERGVRSTVAETYVHACLQTPYNHFSTS